MAARLVALLLSLIVRVPPGARSAVLGTFMRLPPQVRAAGATGLLGAAAANAAANGQTELALLYVVCWALGLLIDLWVIPHLVPLLTADEDHNGVPDVIPERFEALYVQLAPFLPRGMTSSDLQVLLLHVSRVGTERALETISRTRGADGR